MKLTLNTSLGRADANRVGLSEDSAREGATVDVKPEHAEHLLKRGWATEAKPAPAVATDPVKADPPKATKIEGVPATGKPSNG